MANNASHEFRQKIILALIAIIPGVLGLFIGNQLGYNQGQISTQIETIERLNGMQNIEGDNVTINYYSALNEAVSEMETYIDTIDVLERTNKTLETQIQILENEVNGIKHQLETLTIQTQPTSEKYWVTFDNAEYPGFITPSVWYAEAGTSVSIHLDPSEGYYIEGSDTSGNPIIPYLIDDKGDWWFIMPNSNAILTIKHE